MKIYGLNYDLNTFLLAHIADNTAINVYAKTKDAKTGKNKPKSFVNVFSGKKEAKEKARQFNSGVDFDKERRRLIGDRTG